MGLRSGWGHSDYGSAVELGIAAGVGRLILFHHDPGRKDGSVATIESACRRMAEERGIDMSVEAAREESEFVLD
jgi:hypothetical protein